MPYGGTDRTISEMYKLASGPRGELSLELRTVVEDIVRDVRPRDKLSQMAAVYYWFDRRYSFVPDPTQVELVRDPERVLEDIRAKGRFAGDCDDAATFLAAALRTINIPTKIVRVAFKPPPAGRQEGPYTHVLIKALDQYKRWVVLDPVAGKRVQRMVNRVKQVRSN
jgi:transglutaminase-like putative cysteine protease